MASGCPADYLPLANGSGVGYYRYLTDAPRSFVGAERRCVENGALIDQRCAGRVFAVCECDDYAEDPAHL
jgi:hypothetical protein